MFAWPALAGGLALVVRPNRPWQRTVAVGAVGLTALVLVVPPIDAFFQMAQPRPGNPDSEVTAVVAASLLLAILTMALVYAAGFARIDRR